MARMIPPNVPADTPRGERDLFSKLQKDPATKDWVVFHSLDVRKHRSQIEGELDMVILVPDHGILCAEVKGCDVKRINGEWIYSYETSRSTSLKGPFKQASKAMHSLRDYMDSRDKSLSGLLYFSCVIFTNVDFNEESPEWHSWQYINARTFIKYPISTNILNIFSRAHKHLLDKVGKSSWYNDEKSRPTKGQTEKIVSLLRDDFEYALSPRKKFEQTEQAILNFTEEQFEALDLLLDNDRVLFKGPAGTGKTFIALEQARREAANGKSVLFLCFNRLLGDWLKVQCSEFDLRKISCYTFHGLLLDIAKDKPGVDAANAYWDSYLPNKAIESLLDAHNNFPLFDFIVLDEAQDLIKEDYLDILDLLLDGGLAGGRWAFFGDFERQAIYLPDLKQGADEGLHSLRTRSPNFSTWSLRTNCRNAESIARTLTITSGLTPGYKKILNDIDDSDVDPLFYADGNEQKTLLSNYLTGLKTAYKSSEIVILSMSDDAKCCAGNLNDSKFNLSPIRKNQGGNIISFVSIHAFKGLEAPVVVITDIEHLEDERAQCLLYVGMSRARVKLCMLMHERCRIKYDQLLDQGIALLARK